jgi:V8-like Glu-specific endopeptidase
MRSLRLRALAALGILLIAGCADRTGPTVPIVPTSPTGPTGTSGAASPASPASPTGTHGAADVSTVGLLISGDATGDVAAEQTCTGAVVDSPDGNLIVTAAHCVEGDGTDLVFVPGFNGTAPYGGWAVTGAYAAPEWITLLDPLEDYAFLHVSPLATNRTAASVQSVVGANSIGDSPPPQSIVLIAGYPLGADDQPVICSATVYATQGYPSFDCPGYLPGTSGSPWISNFDATTETGTVTAVIGGLNQGGCTADTSYSAPFDAVTQAVLDRARAGDASDDLPAPGPDGC